MVRAEAPAAATVIRAAEAVIFPHAVLVSHEVAFSEVTLDGAVPRCGALRPHDDDRGTCWCSCLINHVERDLLWLGMNFIRLSL